MTGLKGWREPPGGEEEPEARKFSEDAAVVRAMYAALEEEDGETLARCVDPGIGWVDPTVAVLPFDGLRRGWPSVLRNAFRRGPSGRGPRFSAETFLELGDGVLVVGHLFGDCSEANGRVEGETFAHECFVRAGVVTLIREYGV